MLLDKYNRIFTEVFNVDSSQLTDAFTYKDVAQWSSLAHLDLISKLEDTFDIMLDIEDVLHFESYENGKSILRKYGVDI